MLYKYLAGNGLNHCIVTDEGKGIIARFCSEADAKLFLLLKDKRTRLLITISLEIRHSQITKRLKSVREFLETGTPDSRLPEVITTGLLEEIRMAISDYKKLIFEYNELLESIKV